MITLLEAGDVHLIGDPRAPFVPDSRHAQLIAPSRGFLRDKYEERSRRAVATVVHTTGLGPVKRVRDASFADWRGRWGIHDDPFEAALWIYAQAMDAGPHYVVGQRRHEIAQVCPESLCAWHVGARAARPYRRRGAWGTDGTVWWFARWSPRQTPRDLAGGQLWTGYGRKTSVRVALSSIAGSVNANTHGIEVVPNADHPRGPWSDECWENVTELVTDIHLRHSIPATRDRVVTHSDCHPLVRSARGVPWDTTPVQFSWEAFARRTGAPF